MQLYFDTCVCISLSLSLSYFLKQWNLLIIIKVSLSFSILFILFCYSVINFQLHTAPPPPTRGHYRLETRCHTPPISLTTCQHSPTLTPTSGHWLVHVMLYWYTTIALQREGTLKIIDDYSLRWHGMGSWLILFLVSPLIDWSHYIQK